MYGPYYESLAAVPNRELSTYLPGRDAARDAEPIKAAAAKHEGFLWDKAEFSFEDVLDLINPLHHLPVISTAYRESTGDTIGAVPRVLGGALYGFGPIGAAIGAGTALVDVALEAITGKDMGGTMMALLTGDESDGTALAEHVSATSLALGGDDATAADTVAPPAPTEELRTFPGANLGAAGAANPATSADASASHGAGGAVGGAAPGRTAEAPHTEGARSDAPKIESTATRTSKADAANGWITQSILSGLEKYRALARAQDKKPAGLDAVY